MLRQTADAEDSGDENEGRGEENHRAEPQKPAATAHLDRLRMVSSLRVTGD